MSKIIKEKHISELGLVIRNYIFQWTTKETNNLKFLKDKIFE